VTGPRGPAARVRARLTQSLPADALAALPAGYQRLGSVLVVRLPEVLRPHYPAIGAAWQAELGVAAVLRHASRTEGDHRAPVVERIAGDRTETEVVEHGVRYRFDAAAIMFAAGNQAERARIGALVRPGESVVDLFAGIGYFALPAAVHGRARSVVAVEANPVAHGYLVENARRNGVGDRITPILGDNRVVELPEGTADRVILGWLPSAVAWIPRAVTCARPTATLHVHLVAEVRVAPATIAATVRAAVERTERPVDDAVVRRVKPYGPGRDHVVVDVRLAPD